MGMKLIRVNFAVQNSYSKAKCRNLHNIQWILAPVQRTAQINFSVFLQTRIMVDGAEFNSHVSGRALWVYISTGMKKNLNFLKKKIGGRG